MKSRSFITAAGIFSFVPPLVRTALFKTFWFDLQADTNYRETFKAAQGRWLERQVAARLRQVFGPTAVILNPKKADKNRDELAEVVVVYDRNILIVQCKSKGLRHDSRTGADSPRACDRCIPAHGHTRSVAVSNDKIGEQR